jgi:hypothetical protein
MKLFLLTLLLAGFAWADEAIVVIDAGHGGKANSGTQAARTLSSSNNATTPGGLKEKDLALELALEIQKQIAALGSTASGIKLKCVMTREDDTNPDFAQRAKICGTTAIPPIAIVSIHFNASEKHNCLGTVGVIRNKKINGNYEADHSFADGLAKATSAAVVRFFPQSKALAPITDAHLHGGAGSNFFRQLDQYPTLAKVPKCFLEVEFIDRKDVEGRLLTNRAETFPVIAKTVAEHLASLP